MKWWKDLHCGEGAGVCERIQMISIWVQSKMIDEILIRKDLLHLLLIL